MTNAEAAKIGLSNCRETWEGIECEASFPTLANLRKATLKFDIKTKRIVAIDVRVTVFTSSPKGDTEWVALTGNLLAETEKKLQIKSCTSSLSDFDHKMAYREDRCYILPNQTRIIISAFNDAYIGGRNGRNDPHAQARIVATIDNRAAGYMRRQRELKKQKRNAEKTQRFQSGA